MAGNPLSKLRVMVDANVLVAGIGWPRFPYEVLQHAFVEDYQLVLSERIIKEAKYSAARVIADRAAVLEAYLNAAKYETTPTPSEEECIAHAVLSRDSKDVHVALAAINAHVDYLVTQDKDLTDEQNVELHKRLRILLPAKFLREHMGWTSEDLERIRKRTWDAMKG